jgi:hypothetical protein
VSELQAIANYRKSIVNFERVQEAGIGGGGGSATVSLGTISARTGASSTNQLTSGTQGP